MSYAASAALQAAIFAHLAAAPALSGVALHDALPPGTGGTFVLIGPEEVRDASDQRAQGAEHRITLSIISDAPGFLAAKTIAATIADLLAAPLPPLTHGRLAWLRFDRARARRLDGGAIRRIDMSFYARIEL